MLHSHNDNVLYRTSHSLLRCIESSTDFLSLWRIKEEKEMKYRQMDDAACDENCNNNNNNNKLLIVSLSI